jgi:hypothetical protein
MSKAGPTFVAEFADGTITRMTTHSPKGLDLALGIRLSRHAYEARKKKSPPRSFTGISRSPSFCGLTAPLRLGRPTMRAIEIALPAAS